MYQSIKPGQEWLDTEGKRIQAHGASLFYENETYYWYGENKERTTGENGVWTYGIRAYSSHDFYNWQDEGLIILPDENNAESSLHPSKHLDRPHILKCAATGKYVCWIKLSGKDACFIILTADRLLGPYTIEKDHYRPFGYEVGDFDLAQDEETGSAYLYFNANHGSVVCTQLTENYLDTTGPVTQQYENLKPPFCREGIAVFSHGKKHYMITSGMTGYIPNKSDTAVSDSWLGPYSNLGNPHTGDADNASFNSQISAVFQMPGHKNLYVALADRWVPKFVVDHRVSDIMTRAIASHYCPEKYSVEPEEASVVMQSPMLTSANTSIADYVWLPVCFDGEKIRIDWKDEWSLKDYE